MLVFEVQARLYKKIDTKNFVAQSGSSIEDLKARISDYVNEVEGGFLVLKGKQSDQKKKIMTKTEDMIKRTRALNNQY